MSGVALEAPDRGDLRPWIWGLTALAIPAVVIPLWAMGFRADPGQLVGIGGLVGAAGAFNLVRHRYPSEKLRRLFDIFEMLGLCSLLCLLACVGTYGIAAATSGSADPLLARADLALGFDWRRFHAASERSAALQTMLRAAYVLIFTLPIFAIIGLGATGHGREGRRFVLAYGIALALSLALFAAFPAGGPMGHYLIGPDRYQPVTNDSQRLVIASLRAGHHRVIDIGRLQGLVSFPSVHAASAILFTWAVRPLKALFWPMAIANGLMLAATPVEGNHYLVDVIAGIVIAVVSIVACDWAQAARMKNRQIADFIRDIPVIHRPGAKDSALRDSKSCAYSSGDRDGSPSLSGGSATTGS